jgi:hypothetical protein
VNGGGVVGVVRTLGGGVAGLVIGVVLGEFVTGELPTGPLVTGLVGGGVVVRELPGAASATTAVTMPIPATDPATSHFVTRETRRSPESRSNAPEPATACTSSWLDRSWYYGSGRPPALRVSFPGPGCIQPETALSDGKIRRRARGFRSGQPECR